MNDIITCSDLSKFFGEVVAVNNLTLSIGTGVTGLLGPNGAGKSTFIRLVLGMYQPSRGNINVFGENPRNNLDVLRQMGYCPELEGFFRGILENDKNEGPRANAAQALGKLPSLQEASLAALRTAADDPRARVKKWVKFALERHP